MFARSRACENQCRSMLHDSAVTFSLYMFEMRSCTVNENGQDSVLFSLNGYKSGGRLRYVSGVFTPGAYTLNGPFR